MRGCRLKECALLLVLPADVAYFATAPFLCVWTCSNVDSVATWHSAGVVYLSRLAVAYGPGSIAVLVRFI